MSKKILYISYDGMTDPLGQSQVLPYIIGLTSSGYDFTILSFEKKDRYKNYAGNIEKLCWENNIKWVPEFFTANPPFLSKIYDSFQMKRKASQLHATEKYDLIHCRSYVAASAALHLFKKKNIPFLFDMRGFWVDERVDNGQWNLKNPFYKIAYRYYKKRERSFFAKADHIISLTENGKNELVEHYEVPERSVTVIPCCVDLAHFDYNRIPDSEQQELRKRLGIESREKVLSYIGSLGGWYLTREMLEFYTILRQHFPELVFLIITKDDASKVSQVASDSGLTVDGVIIKPAERDEVPLLLSLSNWSIFFIKDAYSKKASSPTKQGEIMAMGIPVICNDIGDTGRIIESTGSGIVVKHLTKECFQTATSQTGELLTADKASIRKAAFQYYDLRKGIESYAEVYNQLLS